jgi:hypothetical protein
LTPCETLFGEIGQALLYQRVLSAFQARRDWWTGLMFFELHATTPGNCDSGITRPDWTNRPAFLLYQAFIAAHP